MRTSAQVTYLTKNLYITDDEGMIIDYLADHKQMPVSLVESQVIGFTTETDFHLVIYLSHLGDRGLQMYVVENFPENIEEITLLKDLFFRMTKEEQSSDLFTEAHEQIDKMLRLAKTL